VLFRSPQNPKTPNSIRNKVEKIILHYSQSLKLKEVLPWLLSI
jgi:hypothetical protein